MRNSHKPDLPEKEQPDYGVHESGRPGVVAIVRRLVLEDDLVETEIVRLELNVFPSGDATWRAWTPTSEDPVGGYLTDF